MSYYIYDQDGYVDEIGNSATLKALSEVLKDKSEGFRELFTNGQTELLDDLAITIVELDSSQFNVETQKSIKWLETILERTVGIAIISDGCGVDVPGIPDEDYT